MDGYEKALKLIAENKKTKELFLDLGRLGLTELPKELGAWICGGWKIGRIHK